MVTEDLLKRLRALCPAKVRVIDAGDEDRTVAVPTRRRKWQQVIEAIEARPWVRCELLDKSGAVLGYYENDGPAGALEELGASTPAGREAGAVQQYLRIMIDAQRQALTFRDKETTELLRGVGEVLRCNTDAIRGLTGLYQAQVEIAAQLAHDKATIESGGTMKQVMEVLEASPQIAAQLFPMIKLLMARNPAAVKPTNGKAS